MSKYTPAPWILEVLAGAAFLGMSSQLNAAGFALIEQGVTGMGTAYASGAAAATDASTIFFNPAGMTRLPGVRYQAALHLVSPSNEFKIDSATGVLPGTSLGTNDGGDAGELGLIPNFYYSRELSEGAYVGLGIHVPYGLSTDYDRGWVGRYYALKSELHTVNINPSIAFKATPRLSLGAGVSVQYISAELSNAIDIGTLNALPASVGGFGSAFDALGLVPTQSDGFVKLEGNDWGFGANFGLLYEWNDGTRLGLAYRSSIQHTLEGDADFDIPGDGVIETATGLFVDTDVEGTLRLPDTASLSLYHDLNSRWAVMGDITWTNWSLLDELGFQFANPAQPDGVNTLNWDDSFRYAIGTTYTPSSRWTYRAGVALDQTPTPNAQDRSPRIPDEDRFWVALGLSYQTTGSLSFDIAYAHLFVKDPKLNKIAVGENALKGNLQGEYDASVDILSAQVNWAFN